MQSAAPMEAIEIVEADLNLKRHQNAVLDLIDAYAMDPMGNGQPLRDEVKNTLISGLKKHPTTLILLAFLNDAAIGIAVCFTGFSTFAARPLINIHDLAVLPGHRRHGVGRLLLAGVEGRAREMDCCKVTLEVLENNRRAMRIYQAAGFAQATYQGEGGRALFYAKHL